MIENVTWTQDDAVFARGIFRSETWAKMMQIMKVTGPTISRASMEQLAFSGLAKDIWEKCLNAFAKFEQDVVEEEDFVQPDFSTLDSRARSDRGQEQAKVTATPIPPPNGSKT